MTNRIAFGSCSSQYYEQVIWDSILSRQPDLFVWGGDAIYADTKIPFTKDPEAGQATPDVLRKLYNEQREHPKYKILRETVPVLLAIDDHDYGVNNGDRTYRYRTESAIAAICEFIEQEGTSMCDRAKQGLGMYGVRVMDFRRPKGQEMLTDKEAGLDPDVVSDLATAETMPLSDRSVAIFTLDVRSNRTPYTKKGLDSYDYSGDFLGERQWQWFEEAIKRSSAAVNVVVQGMQVHADRVGTTEMEFWSNFPASQHRLYQALLQENVQAPILISGDVHFAQLLRKDCRRFGNTKQISEHTTPLLEITTSGMTHAWGAKEHLCARPGSLFLCGMWHFKLAGKVAMFLGNYLNGESTWTELIDLSKPGMELHNTGEGKQGLQFALDLNFGELEIDWEDQSVTARILGKNVGAAPLLSSKWSFKFLSGKAGDNSLLEEESPFLEMYSDLKNHGVIGMDKDRTEWICANYRGTPSPFSRVVGAVVPIVTFISLSFLPIWLPLTMFIVIRHKLVRNNKKHKSS